MKKIRLAIVFMLCITGLSLVMPVPARAATEVKISGWTHDQLYIDYFKTRTAEFEKLHPDIKFTWDWVVKPSAPDDVLHAIAAGEPIPDLLGIERGVFGKSIKRGVI